ncbi:MAG: hypothetical protein AAGF33_07770 [Pseudomonadota bacterium]
MQRIILLVWAFVALALAPVVAAQEDDVCRLDEETRESVDATVDWVFGHPPMVRNSAFILAWQEHGYDTLLDSMWRYENDKGSFSNMTSWRSCLHTFGTSETTICGLKSDKKNSDGMMRGKKPRKGIPELPPQAALEYATAFIGRCFGDRSAGLPIFAATRPDIEPGGFVSGPFSEAECAYGVQRAENAKAEEYDYMKHGTTWNRWNWAESYKQAEAKSGQKCLQMPAQYRDEVAANDPKWIAFNQARASAEQQLLAEKESVRENEAAQAFYARLAAYGEQQRASTPPEVLFADTGEVVSRQTQPVRIRYDDPEFNQILASVLGESNENAFQPIDLTPLKDAAASGCALCAAVLSNTYYQGLFGQTPSIKAAAKYSILSHILEQRPQNGSIFYTSPNFTRAVWLIGLIPDDQLGEFSSLKAAIKDAERLNLSGQYRQIFVSSDMFELVPVSLIDERADSVQLNKPTGDLFQSLRGVGAFQYLADRLLAEIPADQPLSSVQLDILNSTNSFGHREASLRLARIAKRAGQNTRAINHYNRASLADLSDGTALNEKARLHFEMGDLQDALNVAKDGYLRGSVEAADVIASVNNALQVRRNLAAAERQRLEDERRAWELAAYKPKYVYSGGGGFGLSSMTTSAPGPQQSSAEISEFYRDRGVRTCIFTGGSNCAR